MENKLALSEKDYNVLESHGHDMSFYKKFQHVESDNPVKHKEIDKYIVFQSISYEDGLEQLSVPLDTYAEAESYEKSCKTETLVILATLKDVNEI